MGAVAKPAVDRRRQQSRGALAVEVAVAADSRPLLGSKRSLPLPAEPAPQPSWAAAMTCAVLAAVYCGCYLTSLMVRGLWRRGRGKVQGAWPPGLLAGVERRACIQPSCPIPQLAVPRVPLL